MEKYIKLFERLGIGEKISRVYLDLLEHGTSNIAEIWRRTWLHRVEVYRAIPLLEEEKLIISIKKWKRTFYRPLSPEHIDEMIRDFERRNSPLTLELMGKYEKLGKNISVTYQEWPDSVSRVFEDIVESLPYGSVFYRISSEKDVEHANSYLPRNYREKRDKKKLERIVISSSTVARQKKQRLERDLLTLPEEYGKFDENISMTIYGDKISYIDFSHEAAITIDNPLIARFQLDLFRVIEKLCRKIRSS